MKKNSTEFTNFRRTMDKLSADIEKRKMELKKSKPKSSDK